MEQQWGFLAPWCAHLKGRLYFFEVRYNRDPWGPSCHRLWVKDLPTEYDTDSETTLEKIRDALALLAAVARVDSKALNFVLDKYCCAIKGNVETFQVETPFGFRIGGSAFEAFTVPGNDLIRLCGTDQQQLPSGEYTTALGKIAELDQCLKLGEPGVEIEIPVRVIFYPGREGQLMDELPEVFDAEKRIKEMWEELYSNDPEQRTVPSGTLRCKFVLKPMLAELTDAPIEPEMAQILEQALEQNVWFSEFSFYPRFSSHLVAGDKDARSIFGQLMRRVFDPTRRTLDCANSSYFLQGDPANLRQFGKLSVLCYDHVLEPLDFEAMCSAMVLTQTTTKMSLLVENDEFNQEVSGHWWKWMAYALFSRRARSCSAITHLELGSIGRLSIEDMELFTALLSSEHPEEALFSSPRGMVEERDATLRGGAPIRWKLDEAGGPLPNHRALISEHPIKYIRTFSDDGQSEWINVLVPGYGRCQVKRADLIFGCNSPREASRTGITSLSIRFNSETEVAEGLPQLLAAVGGSLTTLSLIGRRELVGDDLLLRCCPNLLELSISGEVVEAQLDLREYQKCKKELPSIICNWHDVMPLSTALMDSGNALTQCLRRLRVRLANPYRTGTIPDGYDPENYESDLDAVLKMLEVNRSLEFLEVTVPSSHQAYISKFTPYDKNPIDNALRLPMEMKLAFLSVVERCRSLRPAKERKCDATASNSALCKLDHLALSTIFGFTAPPVLRRVVCRSVRDS